MFVNDKIPLPKVKHVEENANFWKPIRIEEDAIRCRGRWKVSAAEEGWRVYPLDPHPDAVSLYSGCTLGKHRAWVLPDDRHTASLVELRGGWRHARTKFVSRLWIQVCPGKGLVLPTLNVDEISTNSRFLLIPLPNNELSKKSPFGIHKALIGIGGELKSVKRLRSGDLLIETNSALQTKYFLLAKSFLDCPVSVVPHKFLNSCRGVISEPGLLTTTDAEILGGFSDCTLEPKCINCSQLHTTDSKLCPKWRTEKQIQEIKTNKNISYFEARKLIVPQLTQTYAQATKPSSISTTTQTDPNITNIICPPLQCLKPVSSANPMPSTSSSVSTVSTSSSSTQAHLLPSTSALIPTIQSKSLLPIPIPTTTSPSNNLNTSASSLSTEVLPVFAITNKFAALSTEVQPSVSLSESAAPTFNNEHFNTSQIPKRLKQNSKNRKKRVKEQKAEIEIKLTPHTPNKSYVHHTSEDEDMIVYDVEEDEGIKNFIKDGYSHFITPTKYLKK
ncbi:uncharacterized protein TNCV_1998681 [Trichonephila clavipes]|nr:uncharacterized protein TNCV_1998681 [Trichonephila clavipes]